MSKTHHLKTWPGFYRAIESGIKPFEVRFNDRDFEIGDTLILEEYEMDAQSYTGRSLKRVVTYVLEDFGGVTDGWVVMGLGDTP